MFRSGAQLMILVLLVGLFLMRESRQAPADALEEGFADFLAMNSQRKEAPAPVTLVEINESSLRGHAWPWTPLDFALFFQAASAFQPELLATDEVLQWDPRKFSSDQQVKLPQYQKILREHVLRAPRLLLGAQLGYPEDPTQVPPLAETPIIRRIAGDVSSIPEFTAIEVQAEEDFRFAGATGFTNLVQEQGTHRTVPLLLRYRGQVVPSFVLQSILLWEKLTPDDVAVTAGRQVTLADRLDIPIDAFGRMRVDFGAARGRCGFDELVLASAQADAQRTTIVSPTILNGRMLLLSRTDPDSRVLRLGANRLGSTGELFSRAIATIQGRSFIKRVPVWFDFALLGAVMIASCFVPRWSKARTVVACAVLLVAYVMIALVVFGATLMWVPIVLPAGLAVFVALFRLVTPGLPQGAK
ncbi:MAG TPA: CHASE2 domain-containing protein [Chthoniobacteraceae bacterium]|jgi:hypothetical protein